MGKGVGVERVAGAASAGMTDKGARVPACAGMTERRRAGSCLRRNDGGRRAGSCLRRNDGKGCRNDGSRGADVNGFGGLGLGGFRMRGGG